MIRALLFGGAFNPPTIAHIQLAEYAMRTLGFEKVIFVPTKNSYISDTQGKEYVFSDADRLMMLDRIAADNPWMEVSRYEIEAETQPRTYQTLCHYRDLGYQASLLFGSDKLPELETVWRHVEDICREFGIVCMKRSTDHPEELLESDPYLSGIKQWITILETPDETKGVSSTKIRRLLAEMQEEYASLKEQLPKELHTVILNYLNGGMER